MGRERSHVLPPNFPGSKLKHPGSLTVYIDAPLTLDQRFPLTAGIPLARKKFLPDHLPKSLQTGSQLHPALCTGGCFVLIHSQEIDISKIYESSYALVKSGLLLNSGIFITRWNRVQPPGMERMAFGNPPCGKPRTFQGTVNLYRFKRIGRTARIEAAGRRLKWRDELPVDMDWSLDNFTYNGHIAYPCCWDSYESCLAAWQSLQ